MNPIIKSSAADLAAAELRQEIEAGRWADRLPGARVLAKRLGVSAPTAALALAELAKAGLIASTGERRAFRVVERKDRSSSDDTRESKRLLILTHVEIGELTDVTRKVLWRLRDTMVDKGWRVDSQVVDFIHVKRPQREWDRLIQLEPGTSVIGVYGRTALAEWAVRRKVRMFFLGGVTNGLPIPMVAVKSADMAAIAVSRLTAMGHWKIVLPMCDRAEAFKAPFRDLMRRAVESTGQTYVKNYHTPESDYLNPDVTWRMLETIFATNPPSALVLLDWKELVTAQCLISRLGLKVPEDVSLVLLNNQMEAEWYQPTLSRFAFPERRLVRRMTALLEGKSTKEPRLAGLKSDFIEGLTIAPPRPDAVAPAKPSRNVWTP